MKALKAMEFKKESQAMESTSRTRSRSRRASSSEMEVPLELEMKMKPLEKATPKSSILPHIHTGGEDYYIGDAYDSLAPRSAWAIDT